MFKNLSDMNKIKLSPKNYITSGEEKHPKYFRSTGRGIFIPKFGIGI